MRLAFRKGDFASRDKFSICNNLTYASQLIDAEEVVSIDDGNFVSVQCKGLHRLHSLGVLDSIREWNMFGEDQAIHDEVVVIRHVTKVAAVSHELFAVACLRPQPLSS